MKRILPVSIILVSLYFLFFISNADKRGDEFSTYSHSLNDKSLLRAVSYREKYCFGNCGSITVFQSNQNGTWREITSSRLNSSVGFSGNSFKINNENFFYFWFGNKFCVTTDAGKSWSIWDAEKDKAMKESRIYGFIQDVTIEPNGKGKMFLNADKLNKSGISFFETEDFGKTWHY